MKALRYEDVDDILTPTQFTDLLSRCHGCLIPGEKIRKSMSRARFFADLRARRFRGDVKMAAQEYDVTPRTIYVWTVEYENTIKEGHSHES